MEISDPETDNLSPICAVFSTQTPRPPPCARPSERTVFQSEHQASFVGLYPPAGGTCAKVAGEESTPETDSQSVDGQSVRWLA